MTNVRGILFIVLAQIATWWRIPRSFCAYAQRLRTGALTQAEIEQPVSGSSSSFFLEPIKEEERECRVPIVGHCPSTQTLISYLDLMFFVLRSSHSFFLLPVPTFNRSIGGVSIIQSLPTKSALSLWGYWPPLWPCRMMAWCTLAVAGLKGRSSGQRQHSPLSSGG